MKKLAFAAASAPALALLCWYALSFLAHLDQLRAAADKGMATKAKANPAFHELAELGETTAGIRRYAMRCAHGSFAGRDHRESALYGHLNRALWQVAIHLHFSDEQVFGIWVECALYGCGRGLQEASERNFGKPIEDLTIEELASLVAMVKNSEIFAPGTKRGEERKNRILAAYRTRS